MMVRYNPELSVDEVIELIDKIKENDGYCLCALEKCEDTKCMCKEFRDKNKGTCHCGLYEKL